MKLATARLLVGRRIVAFDRRAFTDGSGKQCATHHDPIFTLDNGARITFSVTETDSGSCYGVEPNYHPAPKRKISKEK
jgi:hypothetical protein